MRNKTHKKSQVFEKNKEKVKTIAKSNIRMFKEAMSHEKIETPDYAKVNFNSEWYIG